MYNVNIRLLIRHVCACSCPHFLKRTCPHIHVVAHPLPYSCLFALITSLLWYCDNNFSVLGCLFLFLLVITTSVFLGECHCCYCKSCKCLIVLPSIYGISLFFHNIKQRKTKYFFLVYLYVGILPFFFWVHESYLYRKWRRFCHVYYLPSPSISSAEQAQHLSNIFL